MIRVIPIIALLFISYLICDKVIYYYKYNLSLDYVFCIGTYLMMCFYILCYISFFNNRNRVFNNYLLLFFSIVYLLIVFIWITLGNISIIYSFFKSTLTLSYLDIFIMLCLQIALSFVLGFFIFYKFISRYRRLPNFRLNRRNRLRRRRRNLNFNREFYKQLKEIYAFNKNKNFIEGFQIRFKQILKKSTSSTKDDEKILKFLFEDKYQEQAEDECIICLE